MVRLYCSAHVAILYSTLNFRLKVNSHHDLMTASSCLLQSLMLLKCQERRNLQINQDSVTNSVGKSISLLGIDAKGRFKEPPVARLVQPVLRTYAKNTQSDIEESNSLSCSPSIADCSLKSSHGPLIVHRLVKSTRKKHKKVNAHRKTVKTKSVQCGSATRLSEKKCNSCSFDADSGAYSDCDSIGSASIHKWLSSVPSHIQYSDCDDLQLSPSRADLFIRDLIDFSGEAAATTLNIVTQNDRTNLMSHDLHFPFLPPPVSENKPDSLQASETKHTVYLPSSISGISADKPHSSRELDSFLLSSEDFRVKYDMGYDDDEFYSAILAKHGLETKSAQSMSELLQYPVWAQRTEENSEIEITAPSVMVGMHAEVLMHATAIDSTAVESHGNPSKHIKESDDTITKQYCSLTSVDKNPASKPEQVIDEEDLVMTENQMTMNDVSDFSRKETSKGGQQTALNSIDPNDTVLESEHLEDRQGSSQLVEECKENSQENESVAVG